MGTGEDNLDSIRRSLYAIAVVGWIALTLASRRRSLVIYNVDPTAFEATLTEVFEQLSRPVERRGNVWISGVPLCELDRFIGGQTVTLRWLADDRQLFQEVERLRARSRSECRERR